MANTKYDNNQLNERQWATYRLVLQNSLNGRITTQKEIIDNYPYDSDYRVDGYVEKNYGEHNNDKCRQVWTDIQFINNCSTIEKQIIIDNYTYRLATETEGLDYSNHLKAKALGILARAWNIEKKIKKNGCGKLLDENGEFTEKQEFIESVMKEFIYGTDEPIYLAK